jgi:hypothetical protein
MSNPRSAELALSDLTIGGDNSSGAFAPAVQVSAARGAFFRRAGVTKADVANDTQDTNIANVSTAVVNEASTARNAELSLTTRVSTEESTARAAELSLGTAVSAEATTARSAELSLGTVVSAEASTARAAELSLTTRVSLEEAARATALNNAISTEVVDRNAAVSSQFSATLAGANQYTDGALSTEVVNRNAAISVALASANNYADGAVNSLSTAVAQDLLDLSTETSTNLANAISTEVVDRNAAISTSIENLSTAVSLALADEESTARSAEASLEALISANIMSTSYYISTGISSATANRIAYQDAADVKFNSIQQAFNVIFDAIDIEKYQGSAPDYFQYNGDVQDLAFIPGVESLHVTKSTLMFSNDVTSQVYNTMLDSSNNLYSVGLYTGSSASVPIPVNNLNGTPSPYKLPSIATNNYRAVFIIRYFNFFAYDGSNRCKITILKQTLK